ncbi:hypothetical protein Aph01nite_41360 [Acrocarpospora phusangensis]|uniref:Uncharacterized protein n=1 Tax=Acrocarpospora phusangensis TaxID=1070424 RepID=A0A919QBL8_9ACTN|nr:hypothetical protein Aph01nite_41360 [Acrocarpospora phusangensis]
MFGRVASDPSLRRALSDPLGQDQIAAAPRRQVCQLIVARDDGIPASRTAYRYPGKQIMIRLGSSTIPGIAKEGAAANYKGYGHHPLASFCEIPTKHCSPSSAQDRGQ